MTPNSESRGSSSHPSKPVESSRNRGRRWRSQRVYQRRLNVRLVIGALAAVGLTALSVHLLHEHQQNRHVVQLLERARNFEEAGDVNRAIPLLRQYVATGPEDAETRCRVALLAADQAKTPREKMNAIRELEALLRDYPDRRDLRRRLVMGWLEFGAFSDARTHLARLEAADCDPGEYEYLQGQCAEIARETDDARRWYTESIAKFPGRIEVYGRLIGVSRDQPDAAPITETLERMLEANPDSAQARVLAAAWWYSAGEREQSALHLAEALEREPGNLDALVMSAELLTNLTTASANPPASGSEGEAGASAAARTPDRAQVIAGLKQAASESPTELRIYPALSRLAALEGDTDGALSWLLTGAEQNPRAYSFRAGVARTYAESGRLTEAKTQLAAMTAEAAPFEITSALDGYLRALDLFAQQKWVDARSELEAVRQRVPEDERFRWSIDVRIAECLRQLRRTEEERRVLQSALQGRQPDATNYAERVRLALLEAAAGRVEDSLKHVAAGSSQVVEAAAYAELLLQQTAQRDEGERRWSAVEDAIAHLEQLDQESSAVVLLRARMLFQRRDPEGAQRLLAEAVRSQPNDVSVWTAAAQLALVRGDRDAAGQLLDAAQQQLGDRIELRMARLRFLTLRPGGPDVDAVLALSRDLNGFPDDEQFRLLTMLSSACMGFQRPDLALSLTGRMCELRPEELETWLPHLEAATSARRVDEAEAALQRIESLDTASGPYWMLGRAIVDLLKADGSLRPEDLQKLDQLLSGVTQQRPEWPRPHRYLGRIQELDGRFEDAIRSYSRAVERGDRDPVVLGRYLALLNELEQSETAEAVARQLLLEPEKFRDVGELRLASRLAYETGLRDKALELADICIRVEEQNPVNHLWKAALLDALKRPAQAEPIYRAVVDRFPADGRGWVGLAQHLVTAGRKDQVGAVCDQAATSLQGRDRNLSLALCCELAGRTQEAAGYYGGALEASPDNLELIREVARFRRRSSDSEGARSLYERLLAMPDLQPLARMQIRRELASQLATGGRSALPEGLRLLEQNLAERPTRQDLLQKGRMLALSPAESDARTSLTILTDLEKQTPLAENDQLLVARLCDRLKLAEDANDRWRRLSETATAPDVLSHCVLRQLSRNQMRFAAATRDRLRTLSPGAEQVTLLSAMLEGQRGNVAEAMKQLSSWADAAATGDEAVRRSAGVLQASATVQENVREKRAELAAQLAEQTRAWLTVYSQRDPRLQIPLVSLLMRDGDITAAFDRAIQATDTAPGELAPLFVQLTRRGRLSEQQMAKIGAWFHKTPAEHPDSIPLHLAAAEFFIQQSDYGRAETSYRVLLEQDGRNLVAINNLSWLLAAKLGRGAEAVTLAEQARSIAGSLPAVVDTQVTALVAAGRFADAIRIGTAEDSASQLPELHFHLALAYRAIDDRAGAAGQLETARHKGFSATEESEKSQYQELVSWISGS